MSSAVEKLQFSEPSSKEAAAGGDAGLDPVRLLGFALYCLWMLLVFYSVSLYDVGTDYRSTLYLNQFVSLSVLVVTLFAVARFVSRADKWVLSKRVIYPYSIGLAFATAIGSFASGLQTGRIAIVVLCAIATGIASGLLFLGWFRLYSDAGSKTAAIEVASGWLLGCVLAMMVFYLPRPACIAIASVSALASSILLRRSALNRPQRPSPKREHRLHARTRHMFVRGAVAAACFGLIDGFSDVVTGYRYIQIPLAYDVILMAGGAVVSAIVLAVALRAKRNAVGRIYRIVIISMALGCLGTPFLVRAYSAPAALIFGGYLAFLVTLVIICTDISNYFDISATKVMGYALSAQYAGELVGLALGFGLTVFGPTAADWVFDTVTLALTGLLLLSLLFLFTERDLAETSIGELIDIEGDEVAAPVVLSQEEELARTVAAMQERFGLSARETDVLPLLVKGRTIARIQEELFISQGTVSTHIRHIYQKTGAQNRQALLDLVDQIQDEERKAREAGE